MAGTKGEAMGWLRAAVGAALIVAPGALLRLSDRETPSGVSMLLMRTIGIRDLVLGAGTVMAARRDGGTDLRRWTTAGLASDSFDVLASLAGARAIGGAEATGAAAAALCFALGDLVVLGGRVDRPGRTDPTGTAR